MSTFEVNLRLDSHSQSNTPADISRRVAVALAYLRRQGQTRYRVSEHRFGAVRRFYATVQADTWSPAGIRRLAVKLGQDCIGVYSPERGQGELIGPDTSRWGGFKLHRFLRFDPELQVDPNPGWDPCDDQCDAQGQHDLEMEKRKPVSAGSRKRLQKALAAKVVPTAFDPIASAMADHPGLTREEAERHARAAGF